MNTFEVITKFLPQAVDKYFFEDSKTAILERGTKYIDVNFKEAGYVKIATILMDGLGDYYKTQSNSVDYLSPASARPTAPSQYAAYAGNLGTGERDGFPIGGVDVKWELFRLQYVRGRQIRIDYIDNEETASVVIGNAVEEFNRTKVIPEVDAVRFSLIADKTAVSLGNRVVENIGANEIISKFNTAIQWLSDHEVSKEELVIFVRPEIMTLIRNTTELNKFITQGDFRSEAGINFTVDKYNGIPIDEVPLTRFYTDVLTTSNGYRPQASSKLINFMIVSTKATIPVRKLEVEKLYGPEQAGIVGYHGYLFNYLIYHGLFVPRNKLPGVYASISSTASATSAIDTLAVDVRYAGVTNAYYLNNFFTNPAGLRGEMVVKYDSAFTLGGNISSVGDVGDDYFVVDAYNKTPVTTAQTTAYFALVDAQGTIIAVSKAVTLPKA